MTTKRKRFSAEFKRQAVELLESGGRSGTEVARELGIRQNQLYKWREEIKKKGDAAFTKSSGRPKKNEQSELSRLKQENERLREENTILKKAATYFAKELP
jgi:transposase